MIRTTTVYTESVLNAAKDAGYSVALTDSDEFGQVDVAVIGESAEDGRTKERRLFAVLGGSGGQVGAHADDGRYYFVTLHLAPGVEETHLRAESEKRLRRQLRDA